MEKSNSPMFNMTKFSCIFAFDKEDNLYTAYLNRPLLEIYFNSGQLNTAISFDRDFKIPEIKQKRNKYGYQIKSVKVVAGMSISKESEIFLVSPKRLETRDELQMGGEILVGSGAGNIKRKLIKHYINSEKTDLYELLVFDKTGKVVASKELDLFCNKIKIHNDRLFIIDSYVGMKIYEYPISFEYN